MKEILHCILIRLVPIDLGRRLLLAYTTVKRSSGVYKTIALLTTLVSRDHLYYINDNVPSVFIK